MKTYSLLVTLYSLVSYLSRQQRRHFILLSFYGCQNQGMISLHLAVSASWKQALVCITETESNIISAVINPVEDYTLHMLADCTRVSEIPRNDCRWAAPMALRGRLDNRPEMTVLLSSETRPRRNQCCCCCVSGFSPAISCADSGKWSVSS